MASERLSWGFSRGAKALASSRRASDSLSAKARRALRAAPQVRLRTKPAEAREWHSTPENQLKAAVLTAGRHCTKPWTCLCKAFVICPPLDGQSRPLVCWQRVCCLTRRPRRY